MVLFCSSKSLFFVILCLRATGQPFDETNASFDVERRSKMVSCDLHHQSFLLSHPLCVLGNQILDVVHFGQCLYMSYTP